MSKFNKFLKTVKNGAIKHSPDILVGLGIVSGISSTVLAVKATPKALMLIEKEKSSRRTKNEDDKLTPIETVKVAWKPYIPAAVSGVVGIACIIGAHSVNSRRNAVIATAYKLTETAFNEYKEAVVEEIGVKKEEAVRERVAKKKVEKTPFENKEVIVTGKGDVLFLDPITNRTFESSVETIRRAVNDINAELISQDYMSLNEFYYNIGLKPTSNGDQLGWNIAYGLLDIKFTSTLLEDGRPCVVLDYDVQPRYDFAKLM